MTDIAAGSGRRTCMNTKTVPLRSAAHASAVGNGMPEGGTYAVAGARAATSARPTPNIVPVAAMIEDSQMYCSNPRPN